jgi:hypothetical protein
MPQYEQVVMKIYLMIPRGGTEFSKRNATI